MGIKGGPAEVADVYDVAFRHRREFEAMRLMRAWMAHRQLDPVVELGLFIKAGKGSKLAYSRTHGVTTLEELQRIEAAKRTGDNPTELKDFLWLGDYRGRAQGREDFWAWLRLWMDTSSAVTRRSLERETHDAIGRNGRYRARLHERTRSFYRMFAGTDPWRN